MTKKIKWHKQTRIIKKKIIQIKDIKPKQINWQLTPEEVNIHRNLDCIFYENCLNYAAIFCWVSFSCLGCQEVIKQNIQTKLQTDALSDLILKEK